MRNTRRAASSPTATTFSCFVSVAIIDGSLITVPRVPPMRRVCMEPISILTSLPRVGKMELIVISPSLHHHSILP